MDAMMMNRWIDVMRLSKLVQWYTGPHWYTLPKEIEKKLRQAALKRTLTASHPFLIAAWRSFRSPSLSVNTCMTHWRIRFKNHSEEIHSGFCQIVSKSSTKFWTLERKLLPESSLSNFSVHLIKFKEFRHRSSTEPTSCSKPHEDPIYESRALFFYSCQHSNTCRYLTLVLQKPENRCSAAVKVQWLPQVVALPKFVHKTTLAQVAWEEHSTSW